MPTYEEKLDKRTRGCIGWLGALILVPPIIIFGLYAMLDFLGIYESIDCDSYDLLKDDIYTVSEQIINQHKEEVLASPDNYMMCTLPKEYKHLSIRDNVRLEHTTIGGADAFSIYFLIESGIPDIATYYIYHSMPHNDWYTQQADMTSYKSYYLDEHVEYEEFS